MPHERGGCPVKIGEMQNGEEEGCGNTPQPSFCTGGGVSQIRRPIQDNVLCRALKWHENLELRSIKDAHPSPYGMMFLLFGLPMYINSCLLLMFIRLCIFLICVSSVSGDMDNVSQMTSSAIFLESRLAMTDC